MDHEPNSPTAKYQVGQVRKELLEYMESVRETGETLSSTELATKLWRAGKRTPPPKEDE